MATPPVRQWGVTPPISTVLPTKAEIEANDDLIAELKAQNNFEQPAETERRCVRDTKKENRNLKLIIATQTTSAAATPTRYSGICPIGQSQEGTLCGCC
jgi:poly(A) polymerase Pap1